MSGLFVWRLRFRYASTRTQQRIAVHRAERLHSHAAAAEAERTSDSRRRRVYDGDVIGQRHYGERGLFVHVCCLLIVLCECVTV